MNASDSRWAPEEIKNTLQWNKAASKSQMQLNVMARPVNVKDENISSINCELHLWHAAGEQWVDTYLLRHADDMFIKEHVLLKALIKIILN